MRLLMDNPFAKLNPATLGNIMSRCDVADIARMRCTDRALASLLRIQAVRNKICEWRQINQEYGYSLIIFQKQNADEINIQKAVRAREVRVIKAGNGVVLLEKDVMHRRRLVIYEGNRKEFNLGMLWHKGLKLPANESSVISFRDTAGKCMFMKTTELEWKWKDDVEGCFYTHPSLHFVFIIEGEKFLKITSMLPQLPLPLRFASSITRLPDSMFGTELVDVNRKTRQILLSPSWGFPHIAFELKHVFEWGDGIIYMLFVGDKNNGQEDLGSWMIKDMPLQRLEFAVFYTHKVEGSKGLDGICRGTSNWLKHFLLPLIYAAPTSVRFDQVELVSSHNDDLFVMRGEKSGALIRVDLWLERENSWGNPIHLIAGAADAGGNAQYIVSFCLWRLNAQYFDMNCILVVARLLAVQEGAWWIVTRRGPSAIVVSDGMLHGISDDARFSLVRHLQPR